MASSSAGVGNPQSAISLGTRQGPGQAACLRGGSRRESASLPLPTSNGSLHISWLTVPSSNSEDSTVTPPRASVYHHDSFSDSLVLWLCLPLLCLRAFVIIVYRVQAELSILRFHLQL